jgi:hypothetical protein
MSFLISPNKFNYNDKGQQIYNKSNIHEKKRTKKTFRYENCSVREGNAPISLAEPVFRKDYPAVRRNEKSSPG